MNQSSKDDSSIVAPKTDVPSKETDTPLSAVSRLSITEEDQIPPLEEHRQEAMPVKKMKNLFFLPEEKLKERYPGLFKTDSYTSEVKLKNIYMNPSRIKRRNLDLLPTEIWWQSKSLSLA